MFSRLDLLFSSTPLDGPEQMALDEVLLMQVERPLLRLYCWNAPCVTFGYFQKIAEVEQLFPGQSLVRRWSGGGCVEHGNDMTFSLIIPCSEAAGTIAPSLFYQLLHEAIVTMLQQYQIMARLTRCEEVRDGAACFVAPRLHDILFNGCKIVGGAQRRSGGNLLHQGSLNLSQCNTFQLKKKEEAVFGKEMFSALATLLSEEVALVKEKETWLEESKKLGILRYRSEAWQRKR